MKRNGHLTGFYLETLLLIAVFAAVIMMLTQVFGLAQKQSLRARELTDAVTLAGNAAEAVAASRTPEELYALLNENENAAPLRDAAGVTASYDRNLAPRAGGDYRIEISWTPEESDTGRMIHSSIRVWIDRAEEPVYSLETKSFQPEGKG